LKELWEAQSTLIDLRDSAPQTLIMKALLTTLHIILNTKEILLKDQQLLGASLAEERVTVRIKEGLIPCILLKITL